MRAEAGGSHPNYSLLSHEKQPLVEAITAEPDISFLSGFPLVSNRREMWSMAQEHHHWDLVRNAYSQSYPRPTKNLDFHQAPDDSYAYQGLRRPGKGNTLGIP